MVCSATLSCDVAAATVRYVHKRLHFASHALTRDEILDVDWDRRHHGGGFVTVRVRGEVLVERFDKAADAMRRYESLCDELRTVEPR